MTGRMAARDGTRRSRDQCTGGEDIRSMEQREEAGPGREEAERTNKEAAVRGIKI